jgi:hypothetical protein
MWLQHGLGLGCQGRILEPRVGEAGDDPLVELGIRNRVDARPVVLALEVDGVDRPGLFELEMSSFVQSGVASSLNRRLG